MWCLIPSTSSSEPVAESLQTSCSDIDLLAQSKSKVIPEKFCWHGSLTESYLNSLSGMTSPHSESTTQTPGTILSGLKEEDRNSPFVAGSRNCARTSVQQVKEKESQGNVAGCGRKWTGSLAKWNQDSFSWKTVQRSLLEESEPCSVIWSRAGSIVDGEYFPADVQEPLLKENGFLLPAPTKSMARRGWGISNVKPRYQKVIEENARLFGRKPHPSVLEWSMGWIPTWTRLAPLAMDRFQSWQQQHGASFQNGREYE